MSRADSLALLERAPCVRVATTSSRGEPILRALNASILENRIVFHGAPAGEKLDAMGREAVVSADEIVASIPSYFVDPERACPATTLYRSVQIHGTLDPIDDPREKARALGSLMAKHQPEGGFVPIAHDHPLYAKVLESLLVFGVSLERMDGKSKLAQNRTPPEQKKIVEALWRRGSEGDADAAFAVAAANPAMPRPEWMRAPDGLLIDRGCGRGDAEACADLLEGTYWNDRFTREERTAAHVSSRAWIVARDAAGKIAASARAISDEAKLAWIYDVIVAEEWRGKGAGDAVMRTLLEHPAMRRVRFVRLATRDAMRFYEKMGFVLSSSLPKREYSSTEMVLVR